MNIDAKPTRIGKLPVPRLATADPGHCPDIPQPTPKIVAPIITFRDIAAFRGLNWLPKGGFLINRGTTLIAKNVTSAAPPITKIRPKSLIWRKDSTISCFVIPLWASPKPKRTPPTSTIRFCFFMAIPR